MQLCIWFDDPMTLWTLDQARRKISRFYKAAKLALAFSEHELSKKTTFTKDIVEPDASRLSGKKVGSPKRTLSSGRTICLVGRFARKWLVASLQPRLSRRGRGPEALHEVKDVVTNAVDKSTILAPDGAPGWAGSARAADIPHLAGVSHGKKTFTPVSKIQKKDVNAPTWRWLERKAAVKKRLAVRSYQRRFTAAGGDQLAENLLGNVKKTARRLGNATIASIR